VPIDFDPAKDKLNRAQHGLSLAFAKKLIWEESSVSDMPSAMRSNTMPKATSKRVIVMPSLKENAKILAAAKADPDAQPLTKKQLAAMVPLRSVRGRPKSENKKLLVSVRYSPEVIAYFRSTGEGWQGRMDGVLSEYVSKHATRRTRNAT
jgi:uncharacterized protein (DUF4415 family)